MKKVKKEYRMTIGKKLYNVVTSDMSSIGMNEYTETITVDTDSKKYVIVRDYDKGFLYRKTMYAYTKDEYGFTKEMHYTAIWISRWSGKIDRQSGIEKM